MPETTVLNLKNTLTISVGTSRQSSDWQPKQLTWEQLVNRIREPVRTRETQDEFLNMTKDEQAGIKDVGGFVGGTLAKGSRKADNVESRQIVALDADYAGETGTDIWAEWCLMSGNAAVMHSTHKHRPDRPRLRLLIPLTRPVSREEYEPIARKIAEWIGIDAFDDTTYEPNRLMFWPSVSSDGEYLFEELQGDWTDPDRVLAEYEDWHDMREWPHSARQDKVRKCMAEKAGDPLTKPGVIGAFNRAYSITEAITTFLPDKYTPCGEGRWTWTGGSTQGGAVSYDNDTFLYSHHDTDPVSGRLCNAFDLVRLHLYGDLDAGQDHDLPDMPSMLAMRKKISDDRKVMAELDAEMRAAPGEVFQPLDSLARFRDDLTEQGTAVAFIDIYGSRFKYSPELGWMLWDGQRWQTKAELETRMLAQTFADHLYADACTAVRVAVDKPDKQKAEALLKRAIKVRTISGLKNILEQAKSIQKKLLPEQFDADPWALNTPDGIIDLRTGSVRGHDPDALCTKITATGLQGVTAEGEQMWSEFIRHITGGDTDFARYLQMLAGMSAIGTVYEEGLVICYGPGGNGKSTFFGALQGVLGEYSRSINADMLIASQAGKTDQNYVVMLRGLRLVLMGETEEGARMGIAAMKRLTSRDRIIARANYQDPMEFTPTHTAIMHTNHLPKLNSLDGGTKRRIAIAPFPATLPPEQVITNYEARLVQEAGPVILRWIVEGAQMFYQADCKLEKPDCVIKATQEYLESEDAIQAFLEDKCTFGKNLHETSAALYQAYRIWSEQNGQWERNSNIFGRALTEKGYTRLRIDGKRCWMGLQLNDTM